MIRFPRRNVLLALLSLALPTIYSAHVYAAKPVDLSKQNIAVLQSLVSPLSRVNSGVTYSEISRSLDARGTLHARIQQYYQGHPVWGADAIVHVSNGARVSGSVDALLSSIKVGASMDGTIYEDLTIDLARTPLYVFNRAQAHAAMQHVLALFYKQTGAQPVLKDKDSELIVFVDQKNKAHWAYKISFYAEPLRADITPTKPIYIIDANTFHVYESWDNLQTVAEKRQVVLGGGYGGNIKMGRLIYDGLQGSLASLTMTRNNQTSICFLKNNKVTVRDYNQYEEVADGGKHPRKYKTIQFHCEELNQEHGKLYWDADVDAVNGAYSPANDALFGGAVISELYQQWYGIPVLTNHDQPMMLEMVVHKAEDNAYWDGKQMTFGDGIKRFYPLTSLGVAAHEVSHGFTEQHSNLAYLRQSGGMNEAFSDMAAQAAEYFVYGKNSWQIGPEIFKDNNKALRYMDHPTRDCRIYRKPGINCSIKHVSQYVVADYQLGTQTTNVHHSSGIYNRAFYLIATAEGWNVRKAFDVMVAANRYYWTSQSTFAGGACGVLKATKELGYSTTAVVAAFNDVGINTEEC